MRREQNQVQELLKSFGIDARIVLRKNHHVVYMKEGAQIVEMLGIMEANHRTYESGKRADLKRNARQCQPEGEL